MFLGGNIKLTVIDSIMWDLLMMFLAASSRGEHTVLVLESRKSTIMTKYKCV